MHEWHKVLPWLQFVEPQFLISAEPLTRIFHKLARANLWNIRVKSGQSFDAKFNHSVLAIQDGIWPQFCLYLYVMVLVLVFQSSSQPAVSRSILLGQIFLIKRVFIYPISSYTPFIFPIHWKSNWFSVKSFSMTKSVYFFLYPGGRQTRWNNLSSMPPSFVHSENASCSS
jgi:hypothetical protein